MQQRAAMALEAVAMDERNAQMLIYQNKLEKTVAERTVELQELNLRLEEELTERRIAEKTLREHDALLSSVTRGASELLGAHHLNDAITTVLELTGQTIAVSRVQINVLNRSKNGHLISNIAHEWFAPGLDPMIDDPDFRNIDISEYFPQSARQIAAGNTTSFSLEDIAREHRHRYEQAEMYSFLQIPLFVEGRLWGNISFIDSSSVQREWHWAETDTLRTLADLIGESMARARFVKELSDANMIIQNSPTILYRLRGEPSFPMIYISRNISKFGYEAQALTGSNNWIQSLVIPADQESVQDAMAKILEPDSGPTSVEFRLRTKGEDYRWVENRYTPVRNKDGLLEEVEGIIIDITERKIAEEKIATMARTDALTGLANRTTFTERLEQAFAAARRGASPFAILYIDLDHFKTINDTLGHPIGDALLIEVARRLRNCTRETDVVARLGGDEYAVLQTEIREPTNAGTLAQQIQDTLNRPYEIEGNDLHITCSIGISPYSQDSDSPEQMLSQADLALYRSKDEGRNRYRFHSTELDQLVMERSELSDDLRSALEQGQLELAYQPQVCLDKGNIVGMEALLRWNHPRKGRLEAREFIDIAEKTGIIMALGRWVMEQACQQMRSWRDTGLKLERLTLNLSALQVKNGMELINDILRTTSKYNLSPADFEFDVTEAILAQTTWSQNDVLNRLREIGCRIAIDNFGTEYSSIDYLRSYSVNQLKISRTFIAKALEDAKWLSIIHTIMQLAADMNVNVVVEGIETEAQRKLLMKITASALGQGHYYSQAVDHARATSMLKAGRLNPHRDIS